MPSSSGIAALHDEALHEPMEYRVVVLAFETKLDKVAACERTFLAPELYVDVAQRRLEADLEAVTLGAVAKHISSKPYHKRHLFNTNVLT